MTCTRCRKIYKNIHSNVSFAFEWLLQKTNHSIITLNQVILITNNCCKSKSKTTYPYCNSNWNVIDCNFPSISKFYCKKNKKNVWLNIKNNKNNKNDLNLPICFFFDCVSIIQNNEKNVNNGFTMNKDIHTWYICETRFTAHAVDSKSINRTNLITS